MASAQNDFSKGSVVGNIMGMAIPMTAAQLINLLYNVVDRIYIGYIPEHATLSLTGLGVCLPVITAVMAFANLFGMGGAPLCSIERGRGNQKEAEAIMGNAASSDLAMLEKTFLKTVSTPVSAILYQTLFLAITAGVLIFGVNKGIERISKVLMPLLFVLMIVLIIRGLTLPGAWEGLKFLFSPKWDQVTANSLLNAMGFTFFSLSVGMGIMVTYGSYISHKENLTTTALWVSVLAFISCILAGLMVIPPVIAFGLNPSAGPGLTFITMPAVFSHIPLGDVFAVCFYGCLLVAALTSMISLFEG